MEQLRTQRSAFSGIGSWSELDSLEFSLRESQIKSHGFSFERAVRKWLKNGEEFQSLSVTELFERW